MEKQMWLVYSIAAGLCWGTYVPLVQQGIRGLYNVNPSGVQVGNPFASFLCVGIAYFLIAVLFPLAMFATQRVPTPESWNSYGITFATLAGAAGAFGALFVIFANRAAPSPDYRMFIPPVIFALAPVLNTVVSLFWHPSPAEGAFVFHFKHAPGWKFYLGILLTGAGAALVLLSKEEAEKAERQTKAQVKPAVVAEAPGGRQSRGES